MPIKLSASHGAAVDGTSPEMVNVMLAQTLAAIKAAGVTDLTDSSGGTASSTFALVAVPADLVNAPNAATNLASKATAEAQLNLVKDALLELATKANAVATATNVLGLTYNGGGTSADGTIAAIGTTTAAATGAQAAATNTVITNLNNAMASVEGLIDRIAVATGKLKMTGAVVGTYSQTVAAITVDTGTAADPGVTKAALDAKLALYAANIATLAAKLNTITGAWTVEVVVAD